MKKTAAALAAAVLLISASGCREDDGMNEIFSYDISSNPGTLDPQQANDPYSELVIENVFMGLLTLGADGSVNGGAASDFTVSADGLTYNFKLRQDIYWSDGREFEKQCTAKDFVYGFKRLFLPETSAPRAKDYYCIKNSEPFHRGMIADSALLGVRAKGDFELEITLEYPNSRFLSMLTEPPAMPCCEEFFLGSQGKYGLSAKCTPSNGAFYLKTWNYDPNAITDTNFLVLGRNSKNAEACGVCPSALNFFIVDEDDFIGDFLKGTTDCISVENNDKSLIKGDFGCEEFGSITCGLIFNGDFELFRNEDFRKALALLADRETMISALSGFEAAGGLVPKYVSMLDKSYRELVGDNRLPGYDAESARKIFSECRSSLDLGLFSGARIIVPDNAAETAVSYIMQEWQREFGFYCVVDSENYSQRLKSGDFDIALLELTGSYNSPAAYLEQFTAGNSGNYIKYDDSAFEELLKRAEESANLSASAAVYRMAEQMLIDKAVFVPLYYKNEYFFTVKGSEGIIYNPFSGIINFNSAKLFD